MGDLALVVQKAYDWNLWILPKVEKFPKSYRFSVGQSLVASSLDLLMNLVDATYQKKILNLSSYEFASQGLDEIGRNLWPEITSWQNLLAAAHAAARGKRKRPDVARTLVSAAPRLIGGAWSRAEPIGSR